jgi:hypothetical protein
MQDWLFERYTNLPEYFREEIADGSFNVRDCCFRLMIMNEEDKDAATDRADKLEAAMNDIASQHIRKEMDDHSGENADWEGGFESLVIVARAAISPENDQALAPPTQDSNEAPR